MVIVPMPASVISRAAEWLQAMHGAGLALEMPLRNAPGLADVAGAATGISH